MRHKIATFLSCLSNWIDGSGWNYDEFDHGYREGQKDITGASMPKETKRNDKETARDFPMDQAFLDMLATGLLCVKTNSDGFERIDPKDIYIEVPETKDT